MDATSVKYSRQVPRQPEEQEMIKVLAFLSKRQDITTQAFIDYYENKHVPLVLSLMDTPAVYKRNYLARGNEFNREDDSIDFDVVSEFVFADREALLASLELISAEAIVKDEENFLDRSRSRIYVIEEHVTAA
jgi:uncharacterized protein (TIGR02118 family)